jgi:hypothetical protein
MPGSDLVGGSRVHHDSGIDIIEIAMLEQVNLAPGALFGGRTDDDHFAGQVVQLAISPKQGKRHTRAYCGIPDQVMPAAVPNVRQRIIFGQDRNRRSPRLAAGNSALKSGWQPCNPPFYLGTRFFEHLAQSGGRLEFLQADFRVICHPVAALDQLRRDLIDLALNFIL